MKGSFNSLLYSNFYKLYMIPINKILNKFNFSFSYFKFIIFLSIFSRFLLYIIIILTRPNIEEYYGFTDYPKYYQIANNIIELGEYSQYGYTNSFGTSTSHQINTIVPYGYPLFLAIIKYVGGDHYTILFIHSVFGVLIILISFKICEYLFNKNVAFICSLICIFDYQLFFYSVSFWMEPVFTFLLLYSLFIIFKSYQRHFYINFIFSGFVIALATLFRTVTILIPFTLIPFFMSFHIRKTKGILLAIVWFCFIFLALSFWTIHKSTLTGELEIQSTFRVIPTQIDKSSNANENILTSIYKKRIKNFNIKYTLTTLFSFNRPVIAHVFQRQMINRNILTPLLEGNFIEAINNIQNYDSYDIADYLFQFLFLLLIYVFFIIGTIYCVIEKKIKPVLFCLGVIVGYILLIQIINYGGPRYRLPILPFIYIISAYGSLQIYNRYIKVKSSLN